jgi:hypothetical protein
MTSKNELEAAALIVGLAVTPAVRRAIAAALWAQRRKDMEAGLPGSKRPLRWRLTAEVDGRTTPVQPFRIRTIAGKVVAYGTCAPNALAEVAMAFMSDPMIGGVDAGGPIYRREDEAFEDPVTSWTQPLEGMVEGIVR